MKMFLSGAMYAHIWYVINFIVFFANFNIAKCKFAKVKLHFGVFKTEMELYISSS